MEKLGARLRIIRERLGLKLHEVELRSHQIAAERGNPRCKISRSWLDRIERESNRSISAVFLLTLLKIYDITLEELLIAGEEALEPDEQDEALANGASETMLIPRGPQEGNARILLPDDLDASVQPPNATELLPPRTKSRAGRYLRVLIGKERNYLHPILPAGTLALVDTHKRAIAQNPIVDNELGRQIFLVELRDGLICCWCEWIGEDTSRLLVVPHPLSGLGSMYLKIGREATIRGQVVKLRISLIPQEIQSIEYDSKPIKSVVDFHKSAQLGLSPIAISGQSSSTRRSSY